jgi:hypothetical protein
MKGEAKLEAKFREKIKKAGGVAFKFVSPGYSGVTDRLVLIPGGTVVFVELKDGNKSLSALQVQFEKLIKFHGGHHEIIRTEADITEFIDKYFWHLG